MKDTLGYRKLLHALEHCIENLNADEYYDWYFNGHAALCTHMIATFIKSLLTKGG